MDRTIKKYFENFDLKSKEEIDEFMKSTDIESRADAYVGHPKETGEDLSITMARNAYMIGAIEQMLIDNMR